MRRNSRWKAWLDAHKLAAAERVVARITASLGAPLIGLAIAPYHKGGFVASFELAHDVANADALIVEVIRVGQRLATGWILVGDVDQRPNAVASISGSSRISVAGVSMIEWWLEAREGG